MPPTRKDKKYAYPKWQVIFPKLSGNNSLSKIVIKNIDFQILSWTEAKSLRMGILQQGWLHITKRPHSLCLHA